MKIFFDTYVHIADVHEVAMLKPLLKEILAEIDNLEPTDRLLLDRQLARRAEKQWKSQSTQARKTARRRKIDQPLIDRLIEPEIPG